MAAKRRAPTGVVGLVVTIIGIVCFVFRLDPLLPSYGLIAAGGIVSAVGAAQGAGRTAGIVGTLLAALSIAYMLG